jgi:hypothetical protein
MLSEESYLTAIYVYLGAAGLILLYLAWWLGRSWRPAWAALAVLLAAALLLTPAYPKDGVDTLAPALIVAGFQIFTEGVEAAEHALRPLAMACGIALVVAVLLRLTLFRRPRAASPPPASAQPPS